jgi:hypothetical protein
MPDASFGPYLQFDSVLIIIDLCDLGFSDEIHFLPFLQKLEDALHIVVRKNDAGLIIKKDLFAGHVDVGCLGVHGFDFFLSEHLDVCGGFGCFDMLFVHVIFLDVFEVGSGGEERSVEEDLELFPILLDG